MSNSRLIKRPRNADQLTNNADTGPTFPEGIPEIIHDYLDADLNLHEPNLVKKYEAFSLFGWSAIDLLGTKLANFILNAGELEVEEAVNLIEQNPQVLCNVVKGRDRLGRKVGGGTCTLIGIAAMIGDFNACNMALNDDPVDKNCGMVERLVKIARKHLPLQNIIKYLQVVTSEEAKQVTKARNQRYLTVIITFGEGLINIRDEINFQRNYPSLVSQLNESLQRLSEEEITLGIVFDPNVLIRAAEWFHQNMHARFMINREKNELFMKKAKAFCMHVYGKLQANLSSRDAHFTLFNNHGDFWPPRSLKNEDQSSYFDRISTLGDDGYLGNFEHNNDRTKKVSDEFFMKDIVRFKFHYASREENKEMNMKSILQRLILEVEEKHSKESQCRVG